MCFVCHSVLTTSMSHIWAHSGHYINVGRIRAYKATRVLGEEEMVLTYSRILLQLVCSNSVESVVFRT